MKPVTIYPGYFLIDTDAWVAQRIGEPSDIHTRALAEFLRCDGFKAYHPNMDISARMQLWCAAREWTVLEGMPICHDHPVLTKPVEIVLAADPDRNAWALVSVSYATPAVYRDLTTDEGYWHQVTPVDIVCPAGHRWSWLDQRTLLDSNGVDVIIADVFGPGPDMPLSACRAWQGFLDGTSNEGCNCDGTNAIYCPACNARCDLELTPVPTQPQHRR